MALMTVPQVAQHMGCSQRYAWLLTARGELPVVRIGRLVRVQPEALAAFEAAHIEGGNESAAPGQIPEAARGGRRGTASRRI
ncbi:MAG TPA: helix-turn-helix domain-containing protein [Candidatus Dormibacteraeota bacterium]|nr:helix-turn-helix domain-containing protein [Candidatus Dormibacteraeota bacterium]